MPQMQGWKTDAGRFSAKRCLQADSVRMIVACLLGP